MKYAAALIAAAAGASAWANNVTVTTKVVDEYTTYCPGPTQITHGSKTWTVTEATTLTITDCPCTITAPVHTTSAVVCHTCGAVPPPPPPPASQAPPPPAGANNGTNQPQPTGGVAPPPSTQVPTAGAGKAAALSGAGLAAIVGLAAFL